MFVPIHDHHILCAHPGTLLRASCELKRCAKAVLGTCTPAGLYAVDTTNMTTLTRTNILRLLILCLKSVE